MTDVNYCGGCIHSDICMYKDALLRKQQEVDAVMEECIVKVFKRPIIGCEKYQQKYNTLKGAH